MSNAGMDTSGFRASDELPADSTWERFTVVDVGDGSIALHSGVHNRGLVFHTDGVRDSPARVFLRRNWPEDKVQAALFVRSVAQSFAIAEHFSSFKRHRVKTITPTTTSAEAEQRHGISTQGQSVDGFVSLSDDGIVGVSEAKNLAGAYVRERNATELPAALERFRVVQVVRPFLEPGSVVALHCARWNRFLRMNSQADMDSSGWRDVDSLPDSWTWERFTVVDAGHGKIALHNSVHNRFVTMNGAEMETSVPMASSDLPAYSTGEAFAVRYFPTGEIALHNTFFNRYVRMT
ncbi:unnamed protein product, partial [Symbiodinium sp. CCMP2456]